MRICAVFIAALYRENDCVDFIYRVFVLCTVMI